MASKQNNQAHGHMHDIVHDNVTIFSRKVRVFMPKKYSWNVVYNFYLSANKDFFNEFGANNMVKMAHLQFSHKIDHNSQFMASKQNNQAHGHMHDIVHDNVTIFSRKVRVFMPKNIHGRLCTIFI
jgi:hypothetical protein